MLGLRERVDDDGWMEHVELTLRDLWFQKEVADSLGLVEQLDFPTGEQYATVAGCTATGSAVVLSRGPSNGSKSSGWTLSCARDHVHGDWATQTLWDVVSFAPFAVQFLALPSGTSVTVESAAATGTGRIGVRVARHGRHLVPAPGSHLSAVNGC